MKGVNQIQENFENSKMKGDEEETVSRRREDDVCKISVDDTYEGVSCFSCMGGFKYQKVPSQLEVAQRCAQKRG